MTDEIPATALPQSSTDTWRWFIAVGLPEESRAGLVDLMDRLQKGAVFTGAHPVFVRAEGIHLTLAFLGDCAPGRAEAAAAALRAAAEGEGAFDLRLKSPHLFPDERQPRAVVLNVRGAVVKLVQLQGRLVEALRSAGFDVENRAFLPHVTLARIKSMRGVPGLAKLCESHQALPPIPWPVDSITLFRSTLGPGGGQYEILAEVQLPR